MSNAVHTEAEKVGRVFKTIRTAQCLTLRQLAGLADVNPGYLSQVERGLEEPSPEWRQRVTEALGKNLAVGA